MELTYYLYDTYAEVGAGTNKSIVTADIAAEVNGVPVTTVRKQGFMMCRNLTQVTIPEGITTLETQAFAGCPLTQITLPDSLTIIKGNAFSMCTALTELHIPAPSENDWKLCVQRLFRLAKIHHCRRESPFFCERRCTLFQGWNHLDLVSDGKTGFQFHHSRYRRDSQRICLSLC